jgi:16S rRNA (uracil1498-N3)-methyltransferase
VPAGKATVKGLDATARPPVFIADRASIERDVVLLAGPEGRHAATVRRLRPGERADLIDGAGLIAECVVASSRQGAVELTVVSRHLLPRPEPRICVVQAIPKADRGELAVETMTEVGVDVIVPWAAERCVVTWRPSQPGPAGDPGRAGDPEGGQGGRAKRALARWTASAREAAKQSRRAHIPEVTPLASTADVLARAGAAACTVVLDPGALTALGSLTLPVTGEIILVVGPEGGLSPAESAALLAGGATAARLGPTILRSSTAGTAAAAVLLSRCGRW